MPFCEPLAHECFPCKNFFSPFPVFTRTSFMRTSLKSFITPPCVPHCEGGKERGLLVAAVPHNDFSYILFIFSRDRLETCPYNIHGYHACTSRALSIAFTGHSSKQIIHPLQLS